MSQSPDAPTPREIWHLPTEHIGRTVLVYSQLDSTNTRAAELAVTLGQAADGLVVLADVQTAGRGQHGRRWHATAGASVLMSVVIRPPVYLIRPAILTAWAGVCVAELVRQLCGQDAQLKWPNDVLLMGKKVCGILIEQRHATVVGIGVNVQQSAADFAAAQLPDAGSLRMFCTDSPAPPTATVARLLVAILDREYAALRADAPRRSAALNSLWRRWNERLGLLGRRVRVELTDGSQREGWVRGLTLVGLTLAAGPDVGVEPNPESDPDDTAQRRAFWSCESIRHFSVIDSSK